MDVKGNVIIKARKNDEFCQDKGCFEKRNDAYVLVIADGAGSRYFSGMGADASVDTLSSLMTYNFDKYYMLDETEMLRGEIIGEIVSVLRSIAGVIRTDVEELGSTFAGVSIKDGKYIVIALGDTDILKVKNGRWIQEIPPKNFGSSSVTVLTTSRTAEEYIVIKKGILDHVDGFVIMTDGARSVRDENLPEWHKMDTESFENAMKNLLQNGCKLTDDSSLGVIKLAHN